VNAELKEHKTYYFLFSYKFLFGGAVMPSPELHGDVDRQPAKRMTSRYKRVE